ncbi:copper transporter [Leekyejoonella antrihumi]|uniref:copper transporter n=1 Tax=Leekyejoonella antrihumi TaxID=1660198 RepID=UPI001647FC32|nr:copper transporter [Leekyejoonella antrihumi]
MIDFRYHIVSLVAVFLALAIGIVIGGFSLRGQVGDSLNAQVTQLRSEKNTLRGQASQSAAATKQRDAYIGAVLPTVVTGSLIHKSVAIVVLPGTDDALVRSTTTTVKTAGGSVASTSYLSKDWAAAGFSSKEGIPGLATALHIDSSDTSADRLPGTVLGKAVAGGSPQKSTASAAGVLPQLVKDQVISVHPARPAGASAVVVLWSPMSAGNNNGDAITAWTNLVAAVGASVNAVVGVSAGDVGDDPSTPDALVTALRRTPDSAARMSTIDDGDLSMGQGAMALALRDELHGKSGQYGVAHDATATLPKDLGK